MSTRGDARGKTKKMREIPVLYNGAMVRAILDDRKTQTRRIVKPQPWRHPDTGVLWIGEDTKVEDLLADRAGICKYLPGDRLWVRETWMPYDTSTEDDAVWVLYKASNDQRPDGIAPEKFGSGVRRSAPVQVVEWARDAIEMEEVVGGRWRPSIHMPRWAARLFLDVQDVRIERLQDISEEDARAEGVDRNEGKWVDEDGRTRSSYRLAFQQLWISVYGAESWAANPWVWVTEFRKVP